jgi:spermidine synthase
MSSAPPGNQAVFRLFFLSGLSGILFEVLWTRIFTFLLGSSIQSVSAVVTAFMLGLGLGSWIFGRVADRSAERLLRLYGTLELAVAASGLLALVCFEHLDGLYAAAFGSLQPLTVKWLVFGVAFVFISVPATLIGGTLPVLVRHIVQQDPQIEGALGRLYAINTLGAAFGAIAMLLLVWFLGYQASYGVALAINTATGLGALWLGRRPRAPATEEPPNPTDPPEPTQPVRHARGLLVCFATSGFCALVYEVIWFRTFDFLLLGKLTTFAIVLATYLLGISLGSLAMVGHRSAPGDLARFAGLEVVIGVLGLLTFPILASATASGSRPVGIAVFFTLIFATTFVLGGLFPLVGGLAAGPIRLLGTTVGDIYSANTLGSVLGSFLTGFVLIPAVGTRAAYLFAAVLNLGIGLALGRMAWSDRRSSLGPERPLTSAPGWLSVLAVGASVLALALALSRDWVTRYYEHAVLRPGFHFIAQKEGSLQSVMVAESDAGDRVLLGGPFQSGETVLTRRQTQQLQAHLPMLLHPHPEHVLEIGYGVGEIAHTVNLYNPEFLHLVEIDENMIPMADRWFDALNHHASQEPNVRISTLDGRYFLRMTRERFDVILSDSMILASEGSLRLYTLEHFQAAREHLAEGGMMIVWLPLNVGVAKSRVIMKTFLQAFPQSLLWLPLGHNTQEAYLVGFRDSVEVDPSSFVQRFETFAHPVLQGSGWDDPVQFLGSFRAGPSELAQLTRDVALVNRDMNPVLDFLPTGDPGEVQDLVDWLVQQDPAKVLAGAAQRHPAEWDALRPQLAQLHQADALFIEGLNTLADHGDEPPEILMAQSDALTLPLRKALESYPAHHAAHVWLALFENLADQATSLSPAEQQRRLEHAVALDPSDLVALAALARRARARGDLAGEAHDLQSIARLNPYARRPPSPPPP